MQRLANRKDLFTFEEFEQVLSVIDNIDLIEDTVRVFITDSAVVSRDEFWLAIKSVTRVRLEAPSFSCALAHVFLLLYLSFLTEQAERTSDPCFVHLIRRQR